MRVYKDVIQKNRNMILLFGIISVMNLTIFILYNIMIEPLLYTMCVGVFFMIILLVVDYMQEVKKERRLKEILTGIQYEWKNLPEANNLIEEDYANMVRVLGSELEKAIYDFQIAKQDSLDYYTAWVHQIKTPIAVMKLKLSDDLEQSHSLLNELFRIEQYVDMVLEYIRLGSEYNDLVIEEYDLDSLVRESIRKYASSFIEKKLGMEFIASKQIIVTDKKWFCFILEQLLSNAIKYTQSGKVSIYFKDHYLMIEDTGIGISEEDLPKIFEKGYTGNNGRLGKKSSGLGLYLTKKAANLLSIQIDVQSEVGKGTIFSLNLKQ